MGETSARTISEVAWPLLPQPHAVLLRELRHLLHMGSRTAPAGYLRNPAEVGWSPGGVEERPPASSSRYSSKPAGGMISSTLAGSGPGFQHV
jgi:hypothetical protein